VDDFASRVAGVSALAEPVRRELYLFVVGQAEAVSRDQAAAGVGVERHSAKFHLDRLVRDGLLETESRRLTGRRVRARDTRPSSTGARRARCRSRCPSGGTTRRGLLARRSTTPCATVPRARRPARAAAAAGARLAENEDGRGRRGLSRDPLGRACHALAAHGYEPRLVGATITLANCPFHAWPVSTASSCAG